MLRKLISFFAVLIASFSPVAAFAVTPYDDLVTIADFSGLATTQLTILSVVVTMALVTTAAVILIALLRKGRAGAR